MNKKKYYDLVEEAHNKKMRITKQMEKDIRQVYREVVKDLEYKLSKVQSNTLSEKWLYDYKKSLEKEIDFITKSIYKTVKDKMQEVIRASNSPQLNLFNTLDDKYSLGLKATFNSMFSRVNSEVLNEILRGSIYKDNLGLSDRLWINSKHMKKDIQSIIMEGIAGKKSAYDLAKDLEMYVNPDVKKDWDWSKVYPSTRKKIDYNAQRLARTSIQHSYQMAQKRSCKDNPFIEGIRWHSVFSHGRTCQLCMDRDGMVFKADTVPLDHPNGMCYQVPEIAMSFEDIGTTLREWVDGVDNDYTAGINKWMDSNL